MTRAQAAAVQDKWKQLPDPPLCEHLHQQMDNNENGYVIGYYHCLDCGEPVNNEILAA